MAEKKVTSDELNQYFFDSVTSKIDPSEPRIIIPEHYGEIKKKLDLKYNLKYSDFNLEEQLHQTGKTDKFQINYSIFKPKNTHEKQLTTIWFIHGVIDNLTGFYPLGNILGVFYRIVFIDLLGMGKSSRPHSFPWSFDIHANINLKIIKQITQEKLWGKQRYVFGHDWGAGVAQIIATKKYFLDGIGLINPVGLNNYWVTEIGKLVTLAKIKYDSDLFRILAQSFVGDYTALKKTMHNKTEYLNQNTLQTFESEFIESEAYDDPKKTPFNTKINYWNIRCLAEHASSLLGKGQLLPKSSTNPNGLDFTKFNTAMFFLGSNEDNMMPLQTIIKLKWILDKVIVFQEDNNIRQKLTIRTGIIDNAGHFSTSDQPEKIAIQIIDFVDNINSINYGFPHYKAVDYIGMNILQRGDFKHMMEQSRKFYGDTNGKKIQLKKND